MKNIIITLTLEKNEFSHINWSFDFMLKYEYEPETWSVFLLSLGVNYVLLIFSSS